MLLIMELGLTGLFKVLCMEEVIQWMPGTLALGLGYMSKEKIGYGDGWLLLALGMWLNLHELLLTMVWGILFCVVFALISGKRELPLVPFLTAAYLLGGMNGR